MYRTSEYQEISRCWSVLSRLKVQFLPGAEYPLDVTDPAKSHFHVFEPPQILKLPQFVFTWQAETRAGEGLTELVRQTNFALRVTVESIDAAGVDLRPDEQLLIWKERLAYWLHGLRVPFYDYADALNLKRYESGDFMLRYSDATKASAEDGDEQNTLILRVSAEIR